MVSTSAAMGIGQVLGKRSDETLRVRHWRVTREGVPKGASACEIRRSPRVIVSL